MYPRLKHLLIPFVLFCSSLKAQVSVSGTVADKSGGLPGATVKIMNPDSGFVTGGSTDNDGNFSFPLPGNKTYIVRFIYLGYTDQFRKVAVGQDPVTIGKINMHENAQNLKEVEVQGIQKRGEQKGDTTSFNADAFKTNPDATAEDLVKKMPGITSDNNGLKVNGETVTKVLVDGKPFFGDDPNAAIKNLPAEIIDKVEVFDKMSDQAAFTGFNDGDQSKTVNIVTKKGKNVGQFGKAYAGAGTDDRYNAGGTLNNFKDKQRITLLLLSNNINVQNFSISDITGSMGSSGSNGNRAGGPGGAASSLLTAPQNGITATQSAGLNYSDQWGKKINVSGSYFFNYSENNNLSSNRRNYYTNNHLVNDQTTSTSTYNHNDRANLRFEYNIDSANKLTVVPSLNYQNNTSNSVLTGSNSILDAILKSTNTRSDILNGGYDFNNAILYQHKLKKVGRTISLNIVTQLSERENDGSYYSQNVDYSEDSTNTLDQHFSTYGYTKKIAPNLVYTEPLSKFSQLLVSYNPSYTIGQSNKITDDRDTTTGAYNRFDGPLSNMYNNVYTTQRGGLGYKYRKNKMNLSFGADAQSSVLTGSQTYPVAFKIDHSFQNILPNATLNYRFSKIKNLRIYYRATTSIPSLTQLQNVLNISNPLQVQTGNPELKQTFENNLNIRFGGFNPKTSRNAMLFINANYTDNYVSNATYILNRDSTIQNYRLRSGSQLTKPINQNGYYYGRGFFVYGFPLGFIKSNINLNGGLTYNHTPSLINGLLNYSNSYATSGGAFIGSNISPKVDFSVGYSAGYTIVKNSVQKQSDNSYYNHTITFKLNWMFWKGFVLNTDVTNTLYNGLSQNYNQEYILWNAYLGYKFLKNKALEAKISVFDILNQNRSIGRNVTGQYTEDYYTTVLRRYGMFTLTYTIRNFKNGTPPQQQQDPNQGPRPPFAPGQFGPPGGMRPPGM